MLDLIDQNKKSAKYWMKNPGSSTADELKSDEL
jgi:hypothetical protein